MAAGLLIAFDGSPAAAAAVRVAAVLFPGARATVLTVHERAVAAVTTFRAGGGLMSPDLVEQNLGDLERELVGEAKAAAAEGARLALAAGLAAEPAVAPGERRPWEPILAAAAEHGADVVVCGTRGRGAVARSVLGSTSSSLLHHAERAVLIVPEGEAPAEGPVLIAYDGSPAAREAIAAVGRLLPGRTALVVHAWESALRHSLSGRALTGVPIPEIREFSDDLETWLREAAEATVEEGGASWRGPPGSTCAVKPSSRAPPPGACWPRRRRPATPSSSPRLAGPRGRRVGACSGRSPPGSCTTRSARR